MKQTIDKLAGDCHDLLNDIEERVGCLNVNETDDINLAIAAVKLSRIRKRLRGIVSDVSAALANADEMPSADK